MSNQVKALLELAPGKEWTLDGDRIIWHGSRSGRPTLATINAKIAELDAAQPLADLRRQRDALLSETDWVVVRSSELGTELAAEWKTYRQALRDLPATYPTAENVIWPVRPT